MARLMSVAFTEQAVRARRKTVTRRKGWWTDKNGRHLVKVGDRITLCRKVMGRKAGEPLVRLVDVEVIDVRREPLRRLTEETFEGVPTDYAINEVRREGFPRMSPEDFVEKFFIAAQGIYPDQLVTRIEWRYLDTRDDACLKGHGCDGTSHSLPCNNAWFGRSA